MQKYVHLVDLVKSFPIKILHSNSFSRKILIPLSISLQKSGSIKPRTSLPKCGGYFFHFFHFAFASLAVMQLVISMCTATRIILQCSTPVRLRYLVSLLTKNTPSYMYDIQFLLSELCGGHQALDIKQLAAQVVLQVLSANMIAFHNFMSR